MTNRPQNDYTSVVNGWNYACVVDVLPRRPNTPQWRAFAFGYHLRRASEAARRKAVQRKLLAHPQAKLVVNTIAGMLDHDALGAPTWRTPQEGAQLIALAMLDRGLLQVASP